MILRWLSTTILAGLMMILAAGCSDGAVPVEGIVTLSDGTPISGATVSFEDLTNHVFASGVTKADGSYELTTHAIGDGAPLGDYKVSIHHPLPADSSQPETKGVFNVRYESVATSGLTHTVVSGKNVVNFKLDPP